MYETKILKINNDNKNEILKLAAQEIKSGNLVAFPTETVYGLGANGLDEKAIEKIYLTKGRPSDNPLILHVDKKEAVKYLTKEISDTAKKLMDKFWPGPLTIIFPASKNIPNKVRGGLKTVAIRCPENEIARELISLAQVPIAAPSANLSGRPSPTTAQAVLSYLDKKIKIIIDDGPCKIGLESTVVECINDGVIILRPGSITKEMLMKVVKNVYFDNNLFNKKEKPKSPGMKYQHYAPQSPLIVCNGSLGELTIYMNKQKVFYENKNKKVGFLVSQELSSKISGGLHFVWGMNKEQDLMAKKLYEGLIFFDKNKVDIIFAEAIDSQNLGDAIMNRLLKASTKNILLKGEV